MAARAVLGMMALDLITKMFSLSKQNGGLQRAIAGHSISSCKFARGTTDKLLIFGVMLCIGGCAYRITPMTSVATWFMQIIFTLMFLRDSLSIIENLMDAGVQGLGIFKTVVRKKMEEYVDDPDTPVDIDHSHETDSEASDTNNNTDHL